MILLPTIAGLHSINPRTVSFETRVPSVAIESLDLDGVRLERGAPMTAKSGADLEITYTAVELPSSQDCRFQHRLRPLESEWIDAGSQRSTRYTSLPANDYTFEVRAMSPGGPWSEPVVAGELICVLPRWHERVWVRAGGLLLGGLLGALWVRQRTTRLRRRNAALAAEVARREAVERELVASRSDHVAVLETARDGILSVDSGWTVLYANEAMLAMIGRPRGEIIGRVVDEIGLGEVRRLLMPALKGVSRQDELSARSFSGHLLRADRTSIEVELSAAADAERLLDTEDSINGRLTIIIRNVSERTRILERLRREEERFRGLFHTAPSAILVLRPSLDLMDWNERAVTVFGLPPRPTGVETLNDVFPTDQPRDEFRGAIARVVDGDDEVELDHRVRSNEGATQQQFRWRFAPILGREEQILSVICLAVDVTERERAAAHLEDLRRRLVHAEETERSRLARELHDDLSQRLAALALKLQVSFQGKGAEAESVPTDVIVPIQRGIQDVARDVHALSRQLHPTVLEDLGLARALRSECERRSRSHAAEVRFIDRSEGRSAGPEVDLAYFRIAQESLQNAIRHGDPTKVTVTLSLGPLGELCLEVEDDGAGFSPALRSGQAGLGIASMGERARLVGARLEIQSTPGEGTLVSVASPSLTTEFQA